MKSDRRHELQQNDLADFLGKYVESIGPYLKVIGVAASLAVVGLISWTYVRSANLAARSEATLDLLRNASGGDAEPLGQISRNYAELPAGVVARLYQADALLAEGIGNLFEDRELADNLLDDALAAYQDASDSAPNPLVASRAQLGLARTHETRGDLEKAVAAYQRVIEIGESEAMTQVAEGRIAHLKSPITAEFLDWFAQQDFRPADPAQPPQSPSGMSLPDLPDFDMSELSPLQSTALETEPPGGVTLPADPLQPAPETAEPDPMQPDPTEPEPEQVDEPQGEPEPAKPEGDGDADQAQSQSPDSEPAEPAADDGQQRQAPESDAGGSPE